MVDASWSVAAGADCLRVRGVDLPARVAIHPSSSLSVGGQPPPTAGRFVTDGADTCFVPRFGFVAGTRYSVSIDGMVVAELLRPGSDRSPTAAVAVILPSTTVVPRNLLRVHIEFTQPMSEGCAAANVALLDAGGAEIFHALLPSADELWDGSHRRLTVLLDPARIKRGLVAHRSLGYPLRTGTTVRLVVRDGFVDATGARLRADAERSFLVGDDERRLVDVDAWTLSPPRVASTDLVVVEFDRPLDDALVRRCLRVDRADDVPLAGRAAVGAEGLSWAFVPDHPWVDDDHRLVVDPRLEDLAGNSLLRIFDHDLASPDGGSPAAVGAVDGPVVVGFRPGGDRAE